MRTIFYPQGVWGWPAALIVLLIVATPQALPPILAPELRSLADATVVAGVVVYSVALACATFHHLHWRITGAQSTAWLAVGTAMVAVHGLTFTGLRLGGSNWYDTLAERGWALGADLVVAAAVLLMIRVSERKLLTKDPALVGITLGAGLAGLHLLGAHLPAQRVLPTTVTSSLTVLLLVLGALIAHAISRLQTLPPWASVRIGVAVLALLGQRSMLDQPGTVAPVWQLLAIGTGTLGAVVLCGCSMALLREAIHDDRRAIRTMQERLSQLEADCRVDRDRLHEVKGSIAGIASASQLIRRGRRLSGRHRNLLEDMLEREAARLHRLVHDAQASTQVPRWVELDDVVQPLVVARRVQGQAVSWKPGRHRVLGRADDIAATINILLENATRHAPGSQVEIDQRVRDGRVELRISDSGPGIPRKLGSTIFELGIRGERSAGDGIGLNLARRLMTESGNDLWLDSHPDEGAAFVVQLQPHHDQPDEDRGHPVG